jgi:hypothetical protein
MALKDTSKPYILQEPADIAQRYGGDKRKIQQAAAMRVIDPTAAVLAGMFIDQMRSAATAEQVPQQTVAQQTFAPSAPPQMPMGAGLGATPQAQQMPAPAQMPMDMQEQMPVNAAGGGLMSLPVSESLYESYAGGGMVAFSQGSDKPVRGGMTDDEARRLGYGSADEYEAFTRLRGMNEGVTAPIPMGDTEISRAAPEYGRRSSIEELDYGRLSPEKRIQRVIDGYMPDEGPRTLFNQLASHRAQRGVNSPEFYTSTPFEGRQAVPGRPGPTPQNLEILQREQGVLPTDVAPPVSDAYPEEFNRGTAAGLQAIAPDAALQDSGLMVTRGGSTFFGKPNAAAGDKPFTPDAAPVTADKQVTEAAIAADPKAAEAAVKKDGIPGLTAYVEQFKTLLGTEQGEGVKEYKEYLKNLPGELDKRKKEDLWTAVTQFGFALAGTQSPYALQAAGQAGAQVMPTLAAAAKERRGAEGEARKARAELDKMERSEKAEAIKLGSAAFEQAENRAAQSKEKALDREASITAANIAAGKATDMRGYAEDVVKANQGDKAAAERVAAVDRYLTLYGAAGTRAAAAVTQADTAQTNAQVALRDKARDNVDTSLSKNWNSPENKRIRELQKQDKENAKAGNPSNLAGEYTQGLYTAEERRIGGGSTTPAPRPAPAPAQSPAPAPAARPTPTKAAVSMLKGNPSPTAKKQFDEVFGPGAADRALASK